MNNNKSTYIYAITNGIHIKIGYSANVQRRLKQLNTGSANRLYVLCTFIGGRELEQYIHSKFGYNRINGEWFRVDQDMLDYINDMSQDKYVDWDDNGRLRGYFKMKM